MLTRDSLHLRRQGKRFTRDSGFAAARYASAVAALLAACGTAHGQRAANEAVASDSKLDEIIVTATRRSENIQDVPISISAFSQEQIDVQGMHDVDDIARLAPGIQFSRGGGYGTDLGSSISIRGISSAAGAATTGIYIDDTPIQVGAAFTSGNFTDNAYPRLFDIQRVEVLRGPQGTLFGSGSEGGTIRFITPAPSLTSSSLYVRSEVSNTQYGAPSYEAGVAGGAPIIEGTLGFRASVWTRRDGGYVDAVDYYTGQVTAPNNNWTDSLSARFALGWSPVENLTITPSFFFQRVHANGTSTFFLRSDGVTGPAVDNGPPVPAFQQPWGNVAAGQYVDLHQVPQSAIQTMSLPALKADYNFGKVELLSSTTYYDRVESGMTDLTLIEAGGFGGTFFPNPEWNASGQQPQTDHFFTQEMRVQSTDAQAPLKWVGGLFYSRTDNSGYSAVSDPHLGDILNAGLFGPCGTPVQCVAQSSGGLALTDGIYSFIDNSSIHETQKAVFGQVDYQLPAHLQATVGLRHSDFTYSFLNVFGGPNAGAVFPTTAQGNSTATATTPKYMLAWKVDSAMIYASASKGFRNGGSQPPLAQPACFASLPKLGLTSLPSTYKPDSVWSYELGTKFTTDKGRVQLDASVFQINWDHQIQSISLPTCFLSYIANIGSAQSRGFDFDLQWRALDSLLLSVNGGYQFVKATQTITGGSTNIITNGDALPGSQPSVNAAAQYGFKIRELPSYFRVDFSYTGQTAKGQSFNPQDSSYPVAQVQGSSPNYANLFLFQNPSIRQTNVRLGTHLGDWDVSMFCNNLFNYQELLNWNRSGLTFSSVPSGLIQANTLRPRTSGVTAVLRF